MTFDNLPALKPSNWCLHGHDSKDGVYCGKLEADCPHFGFQRSKCELFEPKKARVSMLWWTRRRNKPRMCNIGIRGGEMKKQVVIQTHSFVDLITNSSTEIFATVLGEIEAIEKIIEEVVDKEMGCDSVEFSVSEYEDWDNSNGKVVPGKYVISYDYEINHAPCRMMEAKIMAKLKELFTVVEDE
jgi:hypothetical protein